MKGSENEIQKRIPKEKKDKKRGTDKKKLDKRIRREKKPNIS